MTATEFNKILQTKKLTVATAESITAGLLASTIASVSGASSVLKGGIISYQEEVKTKLLKVNPETLLTYSSESIQTTIEMVKGLANLELSASIYIAVTGVASEAVNNYKLTKPVGQIYVAILFEEQLYTFETLLQPENTSDPRNQIREKTVCYIFEKIFEIINQSLPKSY